MDGEFNDDFTILESVKISPSKQTKDKNPITIASEFYGSHGHGILTSQVMLRGVPGQIPKFFGLFISEPRKNTSYFPLCWLFNRDPYNGLL